MVPPLSHVLQGPPGSPGLQGQAGKPGSPGDTGSPVGFELSVLTPDVNSL